MRRLLEEEFRKGRNELVFEATARYIVAEEDNNNETNNTNNTNNTRGGGFSSRRK